MENFEYVTDSPAFFFRRLFRLLTLLLFVGPIVSFGLTGEINGFHFVGLFFANIAFALIWFFYCYPYFKPGRIPMLQIFFISLLIRIVFIWVFALFFEYTHGFPFITHKDDYIYNEVAQQIADYWRVFGIRFDSGISMATGFYSGYPNFSALLMLVFGNHWWVPRLGNAVLGAFTVVFYAKIVYLIYPERVAKIGVILMMFAPPLITYSSLQLKDTLLIFLLAGSVYNALLFLVDKGRLRNGFFLVLFLTAMIFIRAATIPVIVFSLLFCILSRKRFKFSGVGKVLYGFLIMAVIAGVLFFWNYLGEMGLIETPGFYFESRIESLVGDDAFKGSRSKVSATNLAFLFSTPLFIVGSILLPIPLAIELPDIDFFTNYTYSANIFLMALVPFFGVALYNWYKDRSAQRLVSFFVIMYFLYKTGQAFSLSVFDMRQSLPGIFCMYVILPLFFLYKPKRRLMSGIFIVSVIAIFAYAFVRLSARSLI